VPVAITGAERRDETILHLGGIGDCWDMTWAPDDSQFVALCDGYGWPHARRPGVHGLYNTHLFKVAGGAEDAAFADVPAHPTLISTPGSAGNYSRYYGFATVAVGDSVYQFLSTPDVPLGQPGSRFVGAKLIFSPDNGRTWCNQDGSTPVVFEHWDNRSRANMAFFQEDQEAFSLFAFAQMGRGYGANRDGYVYAYSPNGNTDGAMNELVMLRVPADRVLDRDAYQYFGGLAPGGAASWTRDIEARDIVCTFPRGWVNVKDHPWAWVPSVSHVAGLDTYVMASWGTGQTADGTWFGAPSYLGFWVGANPWGPWTQIHEETSWLPDGDSGARAYMCRRSRPGGSLRTGCPSGSCGRTTRPRSAPRTSSASSTSRRSATSRRARRRRTRWSRG